MECGETCYTSADPEEQQSEKKPITIRAVLLYDGTMNNKTNIESRIRGDEYYQATRSKKYKVFGERVGKGDDSYENGLTNIAALDTYINKKIDTAYDTGFKVYIEGAGTRDLESDSVRGYAIGMGPAGVTAKCKKGINKLIEKVQNIKINKDFINPEEYYIEKLTVDVFGFSRGAATARFAIHKVLMSEKRPAKKRLEDLGYEVKLVEVCFAGLFDTVSSHGLSFNDDVPELKLDAVRHAKKVLHLTAGDEHRENFSLTTIDSAKTNGGEEYYLPGVHSDIGGSYHDDTNEDFHVFKGSPSDAKEDLENLINLNWYTREQIEYREITDEFGNPIAAHTKANRSGLSNAYCRIPLKLMAEESRNQGLKIKQTLEVDADTVIGRYPELLQLNANIGAYKATTMANYNRDDPLIRVLRNKHFHMSAKWEMGLKPRFSRAQGALRRTRQIIEDDS